MINIDSLPINVLEYPHWRVNLRPSLYNTELIPSLGKCLEVVEKAKLSIRGWDYPHLSGRDTERAYGNNWVASWASFAGHQEYWRFYQSGQFIHFFSIREVTDARWRKQIETEMKSHLFYLTDIDWSKVPGFISIINLLYHVTEIFEFAARLCQASIYEGQVDVRVELRKVKGFVLYAEWNRSWSNYYATGEENLDHVWSISSSDLVADSANHSLSAAVWFFERFGWLSPSLAVLKKDQENFLRGHI